MKSPTRNQLAKLEQYYSKSIKNSVDTHLSLEKSINLLTLGCLVLVYINVKTVDSKSLIPFALYVLYILYAMLLKVRKVAKVIGIHEILSEGQFPEVRNYISSIAKDMGIEMEIKLYYNKSNHFIPNIIEGMNDKIILIMPRNLFSLFRSNKSHFTAILAHELNHIKLKDTMLWWEFEFYRSLGLTISIGTMVLAYYVGFTFLALVVIFYGLIYKFHLMPNLQTKRFESELLSDIASIIHTNSFSILEVLESKYIKAVNSNIHPTPKQRITSVKKIM